MTEVGRRPHPHESMLIRAFRPVDLASCAAIYELAWNETFPRVQLSITAEQLKDEIQGEQILVAVDWAPQESAKQVAHASRGLDDALRLRTGRSFAIHTEPSMSFLGEITRRKVFQVAALYAVVAWLIIQVVGAVREPLALPDVLDTIVIVLLAVAGVLGAVVTMSSRLSSSRGVVTAGN